MYIEPCSRIFLSRTEGRKPLYGFLWTFGDRWDIVAGYPHRDSVLPSVCMFSFPGCSLARNDRALWTGLEKEQAGDEEIIASFFFLKAGATVRKGLGSFLSNCKETVQRLERKERRWARNSDVV